MRFFASPAAFRRWLAKNHASASELLVGFHKRDSGRGGITYPQALDEALCFGWIDGIRRNVDRESYSIRFTPRRKGSVWSDVNLRHVERLKKEGRMMEPGLKALAARNPARDRAYSYENAPRELPPEYREIFRASARAWAFYEAQPPGYRRVTVYWVVSARKEETRRRRLALLVESSARGRRAPPFPQ